MNKKDDNNKKIDYSKAYLNDLEEMYNNFYHYSPIPYALDDHHYLNRWLNEGYEMAKKRVIKNNVDYYLGILYYYCGFKNKHLHIQNLDTSLVNRPFVDKSFNETIIYNIVSDKFYYLHDSIEEELLSVNKLPVKEYLNIYIIPYFIFDDESNIKVIYNSIAQQILHFNIMDKNDKTIKKLLLKCVSQTYTLNSSLQNTINNPDPYLYFTNHRDQANSIEIDHLYTEIILGKYLWLNFPTFNYTDLTKSEFVNITNDICVKLNGVETLFIDLRNNPGGNVFMLYNILFSIFGEIIFPESTQIDIISRDINDKQFKYTTSTTIFYPIEPEINIRKDLKIVVLISPISYSCSNLFLKLLMGYKNVFIYGHISKEKHTFPTIGSKKIIMSNSKLTNYYVPFNIIYVKRNGSEDIEVKSRLLPSKFIYNKYIKNNHSQIELLMWLLNDIKNDISL